MIPQIRGSKRIPAVKRPKVRSRERTADTVPFDKAVNMAEVKMFRPQKRKLNEKTAKPSAAI